MSSLYQLKYFRINKTPREKSKEMEILDCNEKISSSAKAHQMKKHNFLMYNNPLLTQSNHK